MHTQLSTRKGATGHWHYPCHHGLDPSGGPGTHMTSGFRWDLPVLRNSNCVSTPRLGLLEVFVLTDTFAEDKRVWIKAASEVQIVCVANQIFTTICSHPPPPRMRWLMRVSEQAGLSWAVILLHAHLFVVWWYLLCLCASPVIRGCCLATANQEASG